MKTHHWIHPGGVAALILMALLARGGTDSVRFEVELRDPITPEEPERGYPLELVFDANGFPDEYRLRLKTDICLERICKPLEATLVWDALGHYSRIEYTDKNPLSKNDHDDFSPADYRRLDQILNDRESVLGRNPLDFFLLTPEEQGDVDGITTATPIEAKNAVVQGAAYSSWALWHWVYGDVQEYIRARTETYCDDDYLLHCLTSGKAHFIHYALRHLAKQASSNDRILSATRKLLETSDEVTCRLALDVLTQKTTEHQPLELAKIVGTNPASTRMLLDYLGTLTTADPDAWVQLSAQLHLLQHPQELKLALALLMEHARDAETVRSNVEALMARNDRILSFRIKKFLGQ